MSTPLFTLLILISLTACSSPKEDKASSAYDDIHLELNKGEKWEISSEMLPHMELSFRLINDCDRTKNKNFNVLADQLIHHKNKFVSSCDMHGESHEILHEWLIPYIGLIEDLDESESKSEQQKIFEDIKNARDLFKKYFK